MTKKEKIIPNMLFLSVFLLLLSFFISNVLVKKSSLLLPLMSGCYILNIFFLILYLAKNNIKIKKKYFIYPALLLIISLLTVGINCNWTIDKINYYDLINSFVKTLNIFCYVIVFININITKEQVLYLMKLFAYLGISACLYNIIFNYNDVIHFYNISSTYDLTLKSFFSNRNQFGAYLFISCIAYTIYLDGKKREIKNYFIYFLFIFNIILTMSRGAILATTIFIGFNLIKEKKYKKIFTILSICFCSIIFISEFFPVLDFIEKNIIRLDTGTTGRTKIWSIAKKIWKETSIFFGAGYYNGLEIAKNRYYFKYGQFHSYFYDLLVDGGLILLGYITFILIKCYMISKNCIDIKIKNITTSAFLSVIIFSFFESVNFLSLGYADMLYTIFFMTLPILTSNITNNNKGDDNNVCNRMGK